MEYITRLAFLDDISVITKIYNQGIEDRVATLEISCKTAEDMKDWFANRGERHKVAVIADETGQVHGWASLNEFNSKCCYSGVADISIYIERKMRGKGLGKKLLNYLEQIARENDFSKLVLSTFDFNEAGIRLYKSQQFREVGTYMNHGVLDGKFINITIMEKLMT